MPTPTIHLTGQFKADAAALAPEPLAGIKVAMRYLLDFGRQAVAPDVRWHIAQSSFAKNCGEIRWPDPELQTEHESLAWRGLFVAATNNSWYLFTVLGNKALHPGGANAWYDTAVPFSDRAAQAAKTHFDLNHFPNE